MKIKNFAVPGEISKKAEEQIKSLVEKYQYYITDVELMPDTHYCNGEVPVGTLMYVRGGINPAWVSADIGCGVLVAKLGQIDTTKFKELDDALGKISNTYELDEEFICSKYRKYLIEHLRDVDVHDLLSEDVLKSFGTIGGGNHFVEVSEWNGEYYTVIHTGSRSLGGKVYRKHKTILKKSGKECEGELINALKSIGKHSHIQKFLELYKETSQGGAVLSGNRLRNYIQDAELCSRFADFNRILILHGIDTILDCSLEIPETITNIEHNGLVALGRDNYVVYKGAIPADVFKLRSNGSTNNSAKYAIPINMRDGTLIGKYIPGSKSKGLPHGAGRLLSRTEARGTLNLEDYQRSMEGIYSTTVSQGTIDEAPDAYKSMDEIKKQLAGIFEISAVLKPVYSYKVG